ncbi:MULTISPECIES: FKBP-type peptidyl-prolyl cis-trans isomerase [unclassified Sphingomonas]|uniref:FKBP-type peptidyl-prolyl cis-trans isomerase n=1 Tax=unclassified Sphingomonas TaxID=196159 RepID=UPI000836D9EA|nr:MULTISPECIES: FKBP-type peptidyl-prolyl cis-trans isomerase [unclassified Sphingomonas]
MSITAVPIAPTKRRYLVWLWIGIAAATLSGVALAWQGTASVVATRGTNEQFLAWNRGQPGVVETASGLQYRVIEPGEGPTPTDTDLTLINYTGTFRNGETFDASRQPTPMSPAQVVPGFGEGLKLMPKGAKFRFWIKPELAYGAEARTDPQTGREAMPANSLLIFDVEMIDFVPEAVVRQMQMQQQLQQQGIPGGPGGPGGPPPGVR